MLREDRLPSHLQIERIGHLCYLILPDAALALHTIGYAHVSSPEEKPPLGPRANRLWAYAGQKGITLDYVISEIASDLNHPRPKLHRLLADPRRVRSSSNAGTVWPCLAWAW